ncbi:hypothetical protein J3Q64DRAFT_1040615 [Phycomyces blakesleeanus]|uniref:F-box domain-containing protein n=2 Tax=Phycomyces blakesleeanus TaxID=4837 RepID=A0ABR3BHE0_PHYBL
MTLQSTIDPSHQTRPSLDNIPTEIVIQILKNLTHHKDIMNCALAIRSWSYCCYEIIWFKPNMIRPTVWANLCSTLSQSTPTYYPYHSFIRRINLSALADCVKDNHLSCLSVCDRLERITLTGCHKLTDAGLCGFLSKSSSAYLVSMDLSEITNITDTTILKIAECCPRLQGLNLSMFKDGQEQFHGVTDESIIKLAEGCRGLRRVILNNCSLLTDASITLLAKNCRSLLEIDLINCAITEDSLQAIFKHCRELREFRLNQCVNLGDSGFLDSDLAPSVFRECPYYDQLRIIDLTGVSKITDDSVIRIVEAAPKIRNFVLNKCHNITDKAVFAICNLGRYLHVLHLGHCLNLTNRSIIQLARSCTRIRYLDLACCTQLTDAAVFELANLQRLKRIGLVKCSKITDESVKALASHARIANSLERVHLSYCSRLTISSIHCLLNACQLLTHLSLTQVRDFLRADFQHFCRKAPSDFSEQQRQAFCVFSGKGVQNFRNYLNANEGMFGFPVFGTAPPFSINLENYDRRTIQQDEFEADNDEFVDREDFEEV